MNTTISFTCGETSLTLPLPSEKPVEEYIHSQAVNTTASGNTVVAGGGYIKKLISLVFTNITLAQKTGLVSFFENTSEGMLNTFTYTDTDSTAYTVRFADRLLKFTKIANNIFDTGIKLELADE